MGLGDVRKSSIGLVQNSIWVTVPAKKINRPQSLPIKTTTRWVRLGS